MRLWTYFVRACRLRCPRCASGRLFRNLLAMHQQCDHCGLRFRRAPGYFLGSIYFNYGLTALLVVIAYPALYFLTSLSAPIRLSIVMAVVLLFPLWFFRYARSLWLAFDLYFDPPANERSPEESGD